MRIIFCIILLLIGSLLTSAQELVVNGGAEADPWALIGWTQANLAESWTWHPANAGSGARAPHSGINLFFLETTPLLVEPEPPKFIKIF